MFISRMQTTLVDTADIAMTSYPPLAIAAPANAVSRNATVSRANFLLFGRRGEVIVSVPVHEGRVSCVSGVRYRSANFERVVHPTAASPTPELNTKLTSSQASPATPFDPVT